MRISNTIAPAFVLLTLAGITKGATPCESEEGKIGWCMNQYNRNDRQNCPLRFNDWAEPMEGDCPNDNVSNHLNGEADLG